MTKILMVCLGNICRSPLAEGILKNKLPRHDFVVESAGTSNYNIGKTYEKQKLISKYHELYSYNKNIKLANDIIVKTIQSLPLPTVFNDQFGRLHTSSDGKKVVVAVNSLLANYSYKYYGKEQGISVNSFLDEKQSFFHVNVLTASDREAPYMMDGIVSSKSTFESEALNHHMHSTDTHVLYI